MAFASLAMCSGAWAGKSLHPVNCYKVNHSFHVIFHLNFHLGPLSLWYKQLAGMLSLNLSNLLLRLLRPDFSTDCWCPSLERRLSLYGRWHCLVSAQVSTRITSTGRHVFIAIPRILHIPISNASFVGSRSHYGFWDFPRRCSIFLVRSTGCPRHTLMIKHGFKELISNAGGSLK